MTRWSASIVIDAPADTVWRVIAHEFDRIGDWATAIPASTACPVPQPATGAPVPGRACHTGIALVPQVTETVVAFDEAGRSLTYQATGGLPSFVTLARNRWHVTAEGPGRARATFDAELRVRGPLGRLLRWLLLVRVGRSGRLLLDDLKNYVEHGRPSLRKQRQLARKDGQLDGPVVPPPQRQCGTLSGAARSFEGEARMAVVFTGTVRRWREDKPGGLAVVDVPADLVAQLGGRRQLRVTGTLNDQPFSGSTMLVAGGGFCVGVSRAALTAAGASVGDSVELSISPAVRD